MGQLIIKQFDLSNMYIVENSYMHKILYELPYITLSGIPIRLHDITITELGDYYKISILNEESIKHMRCIDSRLNQCSGYEPLLKGDHIHFRKSMVMNNIMTSYEGLSYIDISILKVKKHASRCFPIVYIL